MRALTHAARRGLAALAIVLIVPLSTAAQDLPDASEVVDRYVQAMGGRDRLLAHQNSRSAGSFSMPAAGMSGQLVVLSAPGRVLQRVDIEGYGSSVSGYNGEVGWSMDPNLGPRLLEGKELEALKEGATIEAALRSAEAYDVRETMERTEMNGEPCYKVRFVSKAGRETVDCFSTETGLRVGTTAAQETPMGELEVVTLFSDYQAFDGIPTPTRITQQIYGNEQLLTIDSVEYDVVEDAEFDPPPAIRTLIEQQSGR